MNILITGSTGFIGTSFVKYINNLPERNAIRIGFVVRDGSDTSSIEPLSKDGDLFINIKDDYQYLVNDVTEFEPDCVLHLATFYITEHQMSHAKILLEANIEYGTKILEFIKDIAGLRFIYVSTAWEELSKGNKSPVNLYAATKKAFSDILHYYSNAFGFAAVKVKLFDTYGPGDRRSKLFNLLSEAAIENRKLSFSGGEQKMNMTYISDVCAGLYTLCSLALVQDNNDEGLEEYYLGQHEGIPLKEVVDTYLKIFDYDLDIDWGGRPYRDREVFDPVFLESHPIPNWQPKVSLVEGLKLMKANNGGLGL